MPDKQFDLGSYVEVKDRIAILYERFPQARIETAYILTSDPDDKPKVICRAYVYRQPDDEQPAGHGTSWLYLPGATPYTRGSEIENAETSAVGRAIGMLGILIDRSIASAQEIQNKQGTVATPPGTAPGFVQTKANPIDTSRTPEGGLIGIVATKDRYDMNLRQSPDGWALPFRVTNGSSSFGVVAEGDLAHALDAIKATVIDQRVTVHGHWSDEVTPAKGTKPEIKWRLLHLDRIATADWVLPAPDDVLEQPPDDVALVGEAPSAPLGLVSDDVA